LQYDSGYEKRQRAFHHNDDMHISVKELWEAWLRSEVMLHTYYARFIPEGIA
jgi:stromal interaction molecule 1